MKVLKQKNIIILFLTIIFLCGCAEHEERRQDKEGENTMSDAANPRKDIDILKTWFPSVYGIESALWEAGSLSSDEYKNIPGPGVLYAKGFMFVSKAQIDDWFDTYKFEKEDVNVQSDYWDESTYKDIEWYFSWDFNSDYKPGYYQGKFYLSEIGIWFDVMK